MSRRSRHGRTARDGFALLTVLWVLSGMVVLSLLLNRTASEAIGTIQNRSDALRTAWEMEGCLAHARASIDETLIEARDEDESWAHLDQQLLDAGGPEGCELILLPTGTTLDVNVADRDQLLALFGAVGMSYERADSMAAAIVDWRDADDDVQRGGAEQLWYRTLGRPGPRNAPFGAKEELRLVRGLETPSEVDELLGVEPGRILLTRAPSAVLATLPGFGAEAVARTLELRAVGPVDLLRISAALSPAAGTLLQAHQMDLASMTTASPDAWIVTSRARRTATGGPASMELRLLRSGRRAAVMRQRSSPWS
jgi:general secretion pathway protein K